MHLRGNPTALTLLFFAVAVFECGTLYGMLGRTVATRDPVLLVVSALIAVLLVFTGLILWRIFWAVARDSAQRTTDRRGE